MANFSTVTGLSQAESPSLYKPGWIDNTMSSDTDGGYEFRRPRTTRTRRRTIETGFLGLPHADYLLLTAFEEAHTKSVAFAYYDYMHGVTRQMRFDEFTPTYRGVGALKIWDIKIKMSEI